MHRRLPLLRTVLALTAALVLTAILLLGFVRVPRIVTASGSLIPSADLETDLCFQGVTGAPAGASLQPGQAAAIRLDAYPWMDRGVLNGRVASVEGGEEGGLRVTISVDAGHRPGPLTEGLRGEARIDIGETQSLGALLFSHLSGGAL